MNISVEVTPDLLKYLDGKVKSGMFKSRSEAVRTAIRDMIQSDLQQQLKDKGITLKDIDRLRDDVAGELLEKRYGKKAGKSDS
jgi:Arc/MetJ-type ribon-helix-helix transcriptional regulator